VGRSVVLVAPLRGPADEELGGGRGLDSLQKGTTAPAMARAWGRACFPMNAIQSARVCRVRFGPFQAAGIRCPVAVQPGQPWNLVQYLRGHSKPRWAEPGLLLAMKQLQHRIPGGTSKPMSAPHTSLDPGTPRKFCTGGVVVAVPWLSAGMGAAAPGVGSTQG
jgi:hypothetical protein